MARGEGLPPLGPKLLENPFDPQEVGTDAGIDIVHAGVEEIPGQNMERKEKMTVCQVAKEVCRMLNQERQRMELSQAPVVPWVSSR